jgi:hypothetical protein
MFRTVVLQLSHQHIAALAGNTVSSDQNSNGSKGKVPGAVMGDWTLESRRTFMDFLGRWRNRRRPVGSGTLKDWASGTLLRQISQYLVPPIITQRSNFLKTISISDQL